MIDLKEIELIFKDNGFGIGRMLSLSKSAYRQGYPDNVVVFNANVVDGVTGNKLWYGDLDLTLDSNELQLVSNESQIPLIVLSELDCRFGTETNNIDVFKSIGIATFNPEKK